MALLDMCRKDGLDIIAAHVNYHKRKTANRDERIVRDYCKKYGIPFHKKDYRDNSDKGNFQEKARVFRYSFFSELKDKHSRDEVLVAHHLDDLLETYLMQKKKGLQVSYYGLKPCNTLYGIKARRPLLGYTKNELQDYCDRNSIVYGIDESNLSDDYERNRIRHSDIEKMSKKEKLILLKTIRERNRILKEEDREVKTFIGSRTRFPLDEFLSFQYIDKVIMELLDKRLGKSHLEEIKKALSSKRNVELFINNRYLVKEYDCVEVYEHEDDYSYEFDKIEYGNYKHFRLSRKGNSFEGVTLSESDFPITIRNYREGDSIRMRYGNKRVSRFFIDNKIPSRKRKMWPVMTNRDGSAILVPGIGCDKGHFSTKHSVFMIE